MKLISLWDLTKKYPGVKLLAQSFFENFFSKQGISRAGSEEKKRALLSIVPTKAGRSTISNAL